jgi:hypothetical protein
MPAHTPKTVARITREVTLSPARHRELPALPVRQPARSSTQSLLVLFYRQEV